MLGDLTDRIAVVTGAGSGIGRAIATALAQQGATVAVTDRELRWAEETAAAIGGTALALALDVTDADAARDCVADVIARLGTVDILVNNAGVPADPTRESPNDREEDWDRTFSVNVKGTAFCCDAVVPHMQERRYGKILNIASMAGHASRRTGGAYAASKAAVLRYTKGLAITLAPWNINVNAICPGAVWTRFQEEDMAALQRRRPDLAGADPRETFARNYADVIPLGRPQEPEDIGRMAAFLVSEDARNVTGQDIHVDGGAVIRD